jgi:hypothetical protein
MPLAPEPTPEQVKLSAAQSYANYLKYKQALEEPEDRGPWVIVWGFIFIAACSFALILGFGIWYLFTYVR